MAYWDGADWCIWNTVTSELKI